MKVFVVGGTGFLGYYTTLELLKRGYEIATISLPDIPLGDWFPSVVKVSYGNIFEMDDEELIKLFRGFDALVYSVGPDDRYTPDGNAYEFFYNRLVESCGRVVAAAREAGVRRCAIHGSYFAYFDRRYPERKLCEHHPYIRARVEQEDRVIAQANGKIDVMVLELPYIFGTMPECIPLWKDIVVQRLYEKKVVFYPRGGTAIVTADTVAQATAGALERGEHGRRYAIGDENKTWVEMLNVMLEAMGMGRKRIMTVPDFLMKLYGRWVRRKEAKEGKESGLNYALFFKDIQCRYSYIDSSTVKEELGYKGGGVDEAIAKTVELCVQQLKNETANKGT